MHVVIQKFIEAFNKQGRPHKLEADSLVSGGVRLEVSPATDAEMPAGFHLSFPAPLDFSDGMYPMLLLLFVFGKQFDCTGLMSRQASAIKRGRRYTERIGDWRYTSYADGSRWHMVIG